MKKQGSPTLLRELDGKVQKFLIVARGHGTGVGTIRAITTENRSKIQ